jgi:hypothetical protein
MRRKWIIGLHVSRLSPMNMNGYFTSDAVYGTKRRLTGIVEQTNSHIRWADEDSNGSYFKLEHPVRIPEFEHLCAVRESHVREMEAFGIPFKTEVLEERQVLASYFDRAGGRWLCYSIATPYGLEKEERKTHFSSYFPDRIKLPEIMLTLVSDASLSVEYLQKLSTADFMNQVSKVFSPPPASMPNFYQDTVTSDSVWMKLRQRLWDEGGVWESWFTQVRDTEGFFERKDVINYRIKERRG